MSVKIDSHQHFWNFEKSQYSWINDEMSSLKRDFLGHDLVPILKQNNIDGCIAVQARQTLSENNFLLDQAEQFDIVKGIVGWVDLTSYQMVEQLETYSNYSKLKGFRHAIQDEKDPKFMLQMEFIDGVKLLEFFDYTYDILIVESQMPATIRFLENFTKQRFVLDHIGKPLIRERLTNNWKDSIKTLAEYPYLSCKISGMVTEAIWNNWDLDTFKPYLDIIVECFGPDRIMVGSDWPVCLLSSDNYKDVLAIAENYFADFSSEDKDKIFGLNALDFYKL